MPTYTVTDPRSNRTVKLTGDSPPTEAELHQIFAQVNGNAREAPPRTWGDTAADVATGVGKGLANTAIGLGVAADRYLPGVHRLSEAINGPVKPGTFDTAREVFATPTNAPQHVGFAGEQLGEFFLPTGAAGKLGKAAEIAKAGGLTMAQGGSPTSAGLSAAVTAVIPGGGAMKRASGALEQGAEKTMAQALGATKEGMKTTAATLAPEMLARGVRGSRAAMLERAGAETQAVGAKIGAEVQAAAQAGKTVDGQAVRAAIQHAASGLHVANAAGTSVPIAGAEAATKQLAKLDTFVASLGPDIPFDKAAKVKTAWDRIVSKSGLYGPKATSSATDNANAWAIREAASSFRDLLAKGSPTLDDLNQEYKFWKGLKGVLTETERRTQAQGAGLVSAGMGGAGAIVGGMSGTSTSDRLQNAVLGGVAGRQLIKVIQSPAWRTTITGPMKQKLADALASGNGERISTAVGRIVAAVPAQYREAPAVP